MFAADPKEVYYAVDTVLRENLLTPAFVNDPANEAIVEQIRQTAGRGSSKARTALLRVGDPETIAICLADLRSEHWSKGGAAANDLGSSGRLELIAMLAPDLNRDEGAKPKVLRTGGDVTRIKPVSVQAARAIQSLVRDSAAFKPDVRAWAAQLDDRPADDPYSERKRESVRTWWKQNQTLLEAENYGQVQPPVQE